MQRETSNSFAFIFKEQRMRTNNTDSCGVFCNGGFDNHKFRVYLCLHTIIFLAVIVVKTFKLLYTDKKFHRYPNDLTATFWVCITSNIKFRRYSYSFVKRRQRLVFINSNQSPKLLLFIIVLIRKTVGYGENNLNHDV